MDARLAAGLSIAIALIPLVTSASGRRRAVAHPPGVPAQYGDLYLQLAVSLNAAEAQVAPLHPETRTQPVYAAELSVANANRGPALLQASAIDGVRVTLDRFQQLGIRGIVMAVGYPLLLDRFPNSSQYLQFYRQTVAEARKRGMVVEIESSVLFTNSAFSPITWDYSQIPFSQFVQDRHDMTAKVLSELAPDSLDLGAEPDTEAQLTGYSQLNVPSSWAQYMGQVIQGQIRGSTKLGAGLGTWQSVEFVTAEVQLPLDFIALHIYPVDGNSISTAFQVAGIVRGAGKLILIDEARLFKQRPGESASIAADTNIFARDVFDFFAPLDQQYLHFLDGFARAEGVTLISPFWTQYFFAYLPYSPATAALPYSQLATQAAMAASANIVAGQFSATGNYFGRLIAGYR